MPAGTARERVLMTGKGMTIPSLQAAADRRRPRAARVRARAVRAVPRARPRARRADPAPPGRGRRSTTRTWPRPSSFAEQAALAYVLAEARAAQDAAALLDERERIARDLHDLAIQQLFATGLQLETVRRRGPPAASTPPS